MALLFPDATPQDGRMPATCRWIVAFVLTWSVPLAAQPDPRAALARDLIAQGVELRKQEDDRQALAVFERAVELDPSAQALAQRALAEQALGHWLDAAEHLEQALEQVDDPWIAEHRAALEAARDEIAAQLGMLEVSCNVAGAEVRIDGRLLGRTPLAAPLRVVAGQSAVQISAPGFLDITRRVDVDARRLSRLDVTLIATSPPDARPAEPASAPPANAARLPHGAAPSHEPGASPRDVLLYTSVGLASVGLAVGVTGYVVREVNVRLYNEDSRCNVRVGVRRSDECPDEASAWHRGEALAIGGFSTAGVFGALALYLFLARPRASSHQTAFCALGPASFACHGRF